MINYVKKILKLTFSVSKKHHIVFLSILMFLNLIFELFGLILFIPLAGLILNKNIESLNFNNHILDFIQVNILSNFNFETSDIFTVLIICLIFIFFLKFIVSILHTYYITSFAFNIQKALGNKLFDLYINQEFLNFSKTHSSEKIRNINNSVNYFSVGAICLSTLIVELIMFLSLVCIIAFVNLTITIVASFTLIFFLLLFFLLFKKKLDNWSEASNIQSGIKIKNLTETFNSFKEILIYSAKKFFIEKFKKSNVLALQPQRKFVFISMVFRPVIEFIFILIIISVIFIVLTLQSNLLVLNDLIVFIVVISRLIPSINRINFNWTRIKFSKSAIETIYSELFSPLEKKTINTIDFSSDHKNKVSFNNKIELKNISFSYDGKKVLDNLNFEIYKGDQIGIYGKSGCGKSTFLEVLSGINPLNGDIIVDEMKINTNNYNWKKKFCYIPQNFYLLDDSIVNNISFGSNEKKPNLDKINKAIKVAQVDKFLDDTKQGLETTIGEAGLKLSGGQKQRIALARAFYRNPEIILIDEATNSLDYNTASELIESIKSFSKDITIIMVSHDTQVINKMKKIYELSDGKIK